MTASSVAARSMRVPSSTVPQSSGAAYTDVGSQRKGRRVSPSAVTAGKRTQSPGNVDARQAPEIANNSLHIT